MARNKNPRTKSTTLSATARAARGQARNNALANGATPLMIRNGGRRIWTAANTRSESNANACRNIDLGEWVDEDGWI